MNIYISGPISGAPIDQRRREFEAAERQIEAAGHTPVSPLRNGLPPGSPWVEHMKVDLSMLLDADAVLMLINWSRSPGCRAEHALAQESGKVLLHSPAALRTLSRAAGKTPQPDPLPSGTDAPDCHTAPRTTRPTAPHGGILGRWLSR